MGTSETGETKSKAEKRREYISRYYAEHPEAYVKKLARENARYAAHREAINAKRRERYKGDDEYRKDHLKRGRKYWDTPEGKAKRAAKWKAIKENEELHKELKARHRKWAQVYREKLRGDKDKYEAWRKKNNEREVLKRLEIKNTDSQRYEIILAQERGYKKRNPQKYQEMLAQRRDFKNREPEKYREILNRKIEKYREMKESNPLKYEGVLLLRSIRRMEQNEKFESDANAYAEYRRHMRKIEAEGYRRKHPNARPYIPKPIMRIPDYAVFGQNAMDKTSPFIRENYGKDEQRSLKSFANETTSWANDVQGKRKSW